MTFLWMNGICWVVAEGGSKAAGLGSVKCVLSSLGRGYSAKKPNSLSLCTSNTTNPILRWAKQGKGEGVVKSLKLVHLELVQLQFAPQSHHTKSSLKGLRLNTVKQLTPFAETYNNTNIWKLLIFVCNSVQLWKTITLSWKQLQISTLNIPYLFINKEITFSSTFGDIYKGFKLERARLLLSL